MSRKSTVGKNSTHLQVPFLNYMSNLKARAGKVSIRVGGNTQETSVLIPDGFDTGYVIQKYRRPGSTPVSFSVGPDPRYDSRSQFASRTDRDAPNLLLARAHLLHEERLLAYCHGVLFRSELD